MTAQECSMWNSAPQICMLAILHGSWVALRLPIRLLVALSGGVMGRGRKTAANKAKPPNKVDPKTQAKRQRITEDIARVLREAGYECSDEPDQPKLRPDN